MHLLRQAGWIVWKDLLTEYRGKEAFLSTLFFAFLVLIIFNFAFSPGSESMPEVAPGILWVAFTFSGVLSLNRSFLVERETASLEALLLSPLPRGTLYLGKMAANLLFLLLVEALILPMFAVFFNYNLLPFSATLAMVVLLADVGFVAVGTLFAAMAASLKTREILLPILLFPIVVPVLISAVKATGALLERLEFGELTPWLKILVAFDVVFVWVSYWVFQYVVEET